jgi:hypothetical protein
MNDWRQNAAIYAEQGKGPREISRLLEVPYSTCWGYLNTLDKQEVPVVKYKSVQKPQFTYDDKGDNSSILCISDMHIPYHHKDTLDFLSDLKREYKPTRVICMGDELDKHQLSFHDSDPDLHAAGDELRTALPVIASLKKLFPKMDLLESNHGSLVYRRAKHHGIPRQYLKTYNEVLGVDDSWRWHFDLTVLLPNGQPCYFHHGKCSDVLRLSQQMGMCAVQGHFHNDLAVRYWANPAGLYWGLQTGCLIDDKSLAFAYNNVNVKRPLIGTAVIIDGEPVVKAMKL